MHKNSSFILLKELFLCEKGKKSGKKIDFVTKNDYSKVVVQPYKIKGIKIEVRKKERRLFT